MRFSTIRSALRFTAVTIVPLTRFQTSSTTEHLSVVSSTVSSYTFSAFAYEEVADHIFHLDVYVRNLKLRFDSVK